MTFYLQKWIIFKYDTGLSDMTGEPGCTLSWYPFDRMKQENLRLCLILWENKSTFPFFYRVLSRVTKKLTNKTTQSGTISRLIHNFLLTRLGFLFCIKYKGKIVLMVLKNKDEFWFLCYYFNKLEHFKQNSMSKV